MKRNCCNFGNFRTARNKQSVQSIWCNTTRRADWNYLSLCGLGLIDPLMSALEKILAEFFFKTNFFANHKWLKKNSGGHFRTLRFYKSATRDPRTARNWSEIFKFCVGPGVARSQGQDRTARSGTDQFLSMDPVVPHWTCSLEIWGIIHSSVWILYQSNNNNIVMMIWCIYL